MTTASHQPTTALVTGGAGFVGSHLCERLLARGDRVICVDNFITGRRRNLETLEQHDAFTSIEHDVCEPLRIDEPISLIFHMASPASPIDYYQKPIETLRVGSHGTENILALAAEKNARFLFASTSEVYGDPHPDEHPQRETYFGNVNSIGPRSCYDEAKRFSEAMIMAYRQVHGVETRIVRIFNTYGPRMRMNDGRVVPAFMTQALTGEALTVFGEGQQTRSFCYVDDLVEGILRLMASDFHLPVNVGNPHEMTILEFAQEVLALTGSGSTIEYGPFPENDPKTRRPDITRAREQLGWQPTVPLAEGLSKTLAYFREELVRDGLLDPV